MKTINPISAASSRNPYPYYEGLLDGPRLHYNNELKLWIAARADTITEVFSNPFCGVRPSAEPVPHALNGLYAGEVFAHLVRMNDGERHDQPKLVLERALAALPFAHVDARARYIANRSLPDIEDTSALSKWIFDTPVTVVADLLGFDQEAHPTVADLTRAFVGCMSPLCTTEQVIEGSEAASLLRSRMEALLRLAPLRSGSLLARVRDEGEELGWLSKAAIIANLIGLLSQTFEATGGLIGNTLVALAEHPHLVNEVRSSPDGWGQVVHETSRYDSPVQNTRRFISDKTCIAGFDVEPGSAVLLILAAANRDPSVNTQPAKFLLDRPNRCVFSFSRGSHACPGQTLARGIAEAVLAVLCRDLPTDWLARLSWSWKPSANGRLPVFHSVNTVEVSI